MAISDWSTTPANNSSAPPVGAPEGMAAAQVNNVMREMMADIKKREICTCKSEYILYCAKHTKIKVTKEEAKMIQKLNKNG